MGAVRELKIDYYETGNGRVPFHRWLGTLGDRQTLLRIDARLARVRQGNLGDHRDLGQGLFELRLAFGPGYRIYAALESSHLVLLLCAGHKSTQLRDIQTARAYHEDYQKRKMA